MNKILIAAVAFGAGYYFATKQKDSAIGLPRCATNLNENGECPVTSPPAAYRLTMPRPEMTKSILNRITASQPYNPYNGGFNYATGAFPYSM